ncbi:hypothetical protein ACJX0J_020022, partial [Zea mays]
AHAMDLLEVNEGTDVIESLNLGELYLCDIYSVEKNAPYLLQTLASIFIKNNHVKYTPFFNFRSSIVFNKKTTLVFKNKLILLAHIYANENTMDDNLTKSQGRVGHRMRSEYNCVSSYIVERMLRRYERHGHRY